MRWLWGWTPWLGWWSGKLEGAVFFNDSGASVLASSFHTIWENKALHESMISVPAASTSPGNLIEMQILGSIPDLLNENLGEDPENLCFNKHFKSF